MKNVILGLSIAFLLLNGSANAQILTQNGKDSVTGYYSGGSTLEVGNHIKSGYADSIILRWNVVDYDFDAGWRVDSSGVCDNIQCYSSNGATANNLFTNSTVYNSAPYSNSGFAGTSHDFHVVFGTVNPAVGSSAWARVSMTDIVHNTSRVLTFIGYRAPLGVTTINSSDDVVLYPNPARESVNVIYDESAGVRTIAVYNLIGKLMGPIYKPSSSSSAKINLEDMPTGIYFLRLMDAQGHVVATRRFTRQ